MPAAQAFVTAAKPFNKKLREREGLWEDSLQDFLNRSEEFSGNGKRIWVHSASMGEFEQAKPVIEELKSKLDDVTIICSFFSPSGYNNQKEYKYSDGILYLPIDTKANAKYFISAIKPDTAIFVRYELWLNHLSELKKRNIPSLLICATRPNGFLYSYCPWLRLYVRNSASCFNEIYTIGQAHSDYFSSLNVKSKIITTSDTRMDRIVKKVEAARQEPILPREMFEEVEMVLVVGSSWQPDEDIIIEAVNRLEEELVPVRIIFVPHEPTKSHIKYLQSLIPDLALLSDIEHKFDSGYSLNSLKKWFLGRHIAVDSIGKLLMLYSSADAAHIGGAFGAGLHSVTEPAGYGVPLSCGPKYSGSHDAVKLIELGALKVNTNVDEMTDWLRKIYKDKQLRAETGKIASDYVYSSLGASAIIADRVIEFLSGDKS